MKFKYFNKNFFINLIIILTIFLFDRFSKIYVIYLDKNFFGSEIFSSEFLNIILIWNKGIAFGLFSFKEEIFYNILTIIILAIILIIFYMILKDQGLRRYALLMILGGALGNFFDRIIYNAVPDFIDLHVGDFHWFIFNIADIFITFGVILMIILEFTGINKQKKYEIF